MSNEEIINDFIFILRVFCGQKKDMEQIIDNAKIWGNASTCAKYNKNESICNYIKNIIFLVEYMKNVEQKETKKDFTNVLPTLPIIYGICENYALLVESDKEFIIKKIFKNKLSKDDLKQTCIFNNM